MRHSKIRYWTIAGTLALFGLTQPLSAETLLERGTYLMKSIVACGNCHTPPGGPMKGVEMAGGFTIGGPKAPFTAHVPNITPDKKTGIGNWTDAQIIKATREGIRPDGSIIGPPMPIVLYRGISDRDARAIVAYLRTVKPVSNKVAKSEYRMPLPKSYGPPLGKVADVSSKNPVEYGAYLAGPLGHCVECHTPMIKGHPDFKNQMGRGGQEFPGPWGVSVSRNLTPHADGIGKWTDGEVKRAITRGISRDGRKLFPPMGFAYYKNISDRDLTAIVAYFRSLKPMADK